MISANINARFYFCSVRLIVKCDHLFPLPLSSACVVCAPFSVIWWHMYYRLLHLPCPCMQSYLWITVIVIDQHVSFSLIWEDVHNCDWHFMLWAAVPLYSVSFILFLYKCSSCLISCCIAKSYCFLRHKWLLGDKVRVFFSPQ